jgi:integrase
MPRATIDAPITTRAARERLAVRREPYWRGVESGIALGYRRNARGGVWLARMLDGGHYREEGIGRADDTLPTNGTDVLDFRQAQTKAIAWVAQRQRVAAGLEPASSKVATEPYKVADAIAAHLADLAARGSRGLDQTASKADAHILPALGTLPVGHLTRDKLRAWHHGLATAPARLRSKPGEAAKMRKIAPEDEDAGRRRRATANRVLTVLKAALNHARAEGKVVCSGDAWQLVKPFRGVDAPKVRYLSDEEAVRLVNACTSDFRALVTGALLTGCRYGELAAIRAGDIDVKSGTVNIPRSKSGKPRHVVLTNEGQAFFARLTMGKPTAALLFERDTVAKQASRTTDAQIRRSAWGKSDQFRAMAEACTAARIAPAISFHILRHTYASRLAGRGVPMPVIAAQLGHSDTRMTERHYAHLAPSYVADTVRAAFGNLGLQSEASTIAPFPPARSSR